ncbi:MAG: YraN family protein [Deltaproteobacteria bacterium CG11_big_fil_rev_8_21_14_0_20_47_16]|nr:MAG: YraN family protein [Deltaproteobacteria bacterium CG11_big_fil_rev_8_21_14_0_20_47_16]
MTTANLQTGWWGERLACSYLEGCGMQIVARNVRTPLGEIDCVAQKGRELYFVEIKTRTGGRAGRAIEQIPWHKQKRLVRLAQYYLRCNDALRFYPHIAVVAIDGTPARYSIEFIPDAVECGM